MRNSDPLAPALRGEGWGEGEFALLVETKYIRPLTLPSPRKAGARVPDAEKSVLHEPKP